MQFSSKRSALSFFLPMIVGLILGVCSLYAYIWDSASEKKFEEFALGKQTTSYYATVDKVRVHCRDITDAHKCIDDYNIFSSKENVVLWLGNSQLHAINKKESNDVTASDILHRESRSESKYLLTFSQPNASLLEHYLLFEYLSHQMPINTLILPIVFDDLREIGIRHSLIEGLNNQKVSMRLKKTEIGKKLIEYKFDQNVADSNMAALDDTIQDWSEEYLNAKLGELWNIWGQRQTFRGILLEKLYLFRNWVFGIKPSSIRRMIYSRYMMNLQAFKAILESANEQEIKILLYIVPLRNDIQIPYDLAQYGKFKSEIQIIARKNGIKFLNLENLVPAELWGTKDATTLGGGKEVDFMHFQSGGHQLLAGAIFRELKILWSENKKNDF